MKKNLLRCLAFLTLAGILLSSCSLPNPFNKFDAAACPVTTQAASQPCAPVSAVGGMQPAYVHGVMKFSNDIILKYYVEHAVALVDMHGFVVRDDKWEIPLKSQTLGYIKIDAQKMVGDYQLQLPAIPQAQQDDVDNDSLKEAGVQTFAVTYWPNLYGDPYSTGDDKSRGWPGYLASVRTDPENKNEVTGGKLIVWAPDGQQSFPSGFGDDGLLFTKDDPEAPVPAGYSVVDLDKKPFAVSREQNPEINLLEPADAALKDYSELSYSEAFQKMFDFLKTQYAFNGIQDKQPDWDALWAEIQPRVAEAQSNGNALAYYKALLDFTAGFKDGHTSLDGGNLGSQYFGENAGGGLGMAMRELDDGRFVVTFVDEQGPARTAGIKTGAIVTAFNGQPIDRALENVKPLSGPSSTERERRHQKALWLLRSPVGTSVTLTYKNEGGSNTTAVMTSIYEVNSLYADESMKNYNPYALPVESNIFVDKIGYVKVNSNYDDLNLILRLFERALKTFEEANVEGIIIDLRNNSGGANLGFAAFLTDVKIPMSQLEYYSDKTGKFEPEGDPGELTPNEKIYHFNKMITLVDSGCASACELEAYELSQVRGMIVMGMNPTAGVEAEVARGQFKLPEGMSLQSPTGRFVLPDGSLFLEGAGVQPTMRIPIDYQNVIDNLKADVVLIQAATEITK